MLGTLSLCLRNILTCRRPIFNTYIGLRLLNAHSGSSSDMRQCLRQPFLRKKLLLTYVSTVNVLAELTCSSLQNDMQVVVKTRLKILLTCGPAQPIKRRH